MKGRDDLEIGKFLMSSKTAGKQRSPNFGLRKRPALE